MKKIAFLLIVALLGLSNLNAAVGDTITSIDWSTSAEFTTGTDYKTEALPTGYAAFGNFAQLDYRNFGGAFGICVKNGANNSFAWIAYEVSGLTVGETYVSCYTVSTQRTDNLLMTGAMATASFNALSDTERAALAVNVPATGSSVNVEYYDTITVTDAATSFYVGIARTAGGPTSALRKLVVYKLPVGEPESQDPSITVSVAAGVDVDDIQVNSDYQINASVLPADFASAASVVWTVGAESTASATITQGGLLSPTVAGTAYVIATATNASDVIADTLELTVIDEIQQFTVTYDANSGIDDVTTSEVVNDGESALLNVNPTRDGYTFEGWNTLANGSGADFTVSSLVTVSITVFAKWDVFVLGDTIINNDFSTKTNFDGWVYNTTYPTTDLPTNYSLFGATHVVLYNQYGGAGGIKMNNGNKTGNQWLACTVNDLTIGDKYVIESVVTAQDITKTEYGQAAWSSTSDYPTDIITSIKHDLEDGTMANTVKDTVTVSATSMVFAVGVNRLLNSQFFVNKWLVYKMDDSGFPTKLNKVETESLKLYPNPANSVINFSGVEENMSIEIYSASGSLLKTSMNTTVDISDLSQGFYLVKSGNQVKTFIKK